MRNIQGDYQVYRFKDAVYSYLKLAPSQQTKERGPLPFMVKWNNQTILTRDFDMRS